MVPELGPRELKGFQQLIFDEAGIHMGDAKRPLISGRLVKRLGHHGLSGFRAYLELVQKDAAERQVAVDLLTTNETYFFREPKHFDYLAEEIAQVHRGPRRLRVWCAASSSGEEPYTIAMVLAQALGHLAFDILASDISSRMLAIASQALYPLEDAKDIPAPLRREWCLKGVGSQTGRFLIDRPLRERVRFASINLNARLPDVGLFDVIFVRNVMIYFSPDTKRAVLRRLLPHLLPGGHLIVSHSESLQGLTDAVRMVRPSIYRTWPSP